GLRGRLAGAADPRQQRHGQADQQRQDRFHALQVPLHGGGGRGEADFVRCRQRPGRISTLVSAITGSSCWTAVARSTTGRLYGPRASAGKRRASVPRSWPAGITPGSAVTPRRWAAAISSTLTGPSSPLPRVTLTATGTDCPGAAVSVCRS